MICLPTIGLTHAGRGPLVADLKTASYWHMFVAALAIDADPRW